MGQKSKDFRQTDKRGKERRLLRISPVFPEMTAAKLTTPSRKSLSGTAKTANAVAAVARKPLRNLAKNNTLTR
jgi:hypothetical protein